MIDSKEGWYFVTGIDQEFSGWVEAQKVSIEPPNQQQLPQQEAVTRQRKIAQQSQPLTSEKKGQETPQVTASPSQEDIRYKKRLQDLSEERAARLKRAEEQL